MPIDRKIIPELYCSDFQRSLAFYLDAVGFDIVYQRTEERFAYLSLQGAELMIEQPVDPQRRLLAAAPTQPFGRGVNLQIPVDNVEVLFARTSAAEAPIYWPLEERWYRRAEGEVGVRQFVVADPDGYLLRFSEDIGRRLLTDT